ncbi:MAG TPA: T9SS type A sorting domain-containing protein, partial [bacterium]
IEISGYVIANYIAAIRSYSLVGENQIIGWVQHRNYNWQSVKEVGVPAAVNDGKIQFSNLAQDGTYQIEWWLCSSGSVFLTDTVNVVNGSLEINVPPIQWDYAYKISLAATKVETKSHFAPGQFKLEQNFPNPFNSLTAISYQLSATSFVEVDVYNLSGEKVNRMVNEKQDAGYHRIQFDASDLASGIYFYQIKAGDFVGARKMIVLR